MGLSEIEVIEADEVVGISKVETGNLLVMPNPVSTGVFRLRLPSNKDAYQLYMYNSDGIEVKSIDDFKSGNTIYSGITKRCLFNSNQKQKKHFCYKNCKALIESLINRLSQSELPNTFIGFQLLIIIVVMTC